MQKVPGSKSDYEINVTFQFGTEKLSLFTQQWMGTWFEWIREGQAARGEEMGTTKIQWISNNHCPYGQQAMGPLPFYLILDIHPLSWHLPIFPLAYQYWLTSLYVAKNTIRGIRTICCWHTIKTKCRREGKFIIQSNHLKQRKQVCFIQIEFISLKQRVDFQLSFWKCLLYKYERDMVQFAHTALSVLFHGILNIADLPPKFIPMVEWQIGGECYFLFNIYGLLPVVF